MAEKPFTDIATFRRRIETGGTASSKEILWLVGEIQSVTADRDELSQRIEKCHAMLDRIDGAEENTTSLDPLDTRLEEFLWPKDRITDADVMGDD
jgi:hypothetical protein